MNLKDYTFDTSYQYNYKLIGVSVHRGPSSAAGHYVAYCEHFDGKWYIFNDYFANESSLKSCKGNGELPYVLIYKKIS